MLTYLLLSGSMLEGARSLLNTNAYEPDCRIQKSGQGGAIQFSGQDLIKECDFGVVVVIIEYRLGIFGFLPGSEAKADGSLNVGLRTYVVATGIAVLMQYSQPRFRPAVGPGTCMTTIFAIFIV